MITVNLKYFTPSHETWLVKNLGLRTYYLHNKFGGKDWQAFRSRYGWHVNFDQDKQATMFILTFSQDISA